MAEGIGTRNIPSMNWQATDLDREWSRFKQDKGDKGWEAYGTFQWTAAHGNTPAENNTLAGVYKKYADYVKPKRNEIRATVKFNRRDRSLTSDSTSLLPRCVSWLGTVGTTRSRTGC